MFGKKKITEFPALIKVKAVWLLEDGQLDLDLVADLGTGPEELPFTWHPDDTAPLSLLVTKWLADHPGFPRRNKTPDPISPVQVKAEANRRINKIMPRWMIDRAFTGGKPIPDETLKAVASIRAASNKLERYTTIPQDYLSDHHWIEE